MNNNEEIIKLEQNGCEIVTTASNEEAAKNINESLTLFFDAIIM